MMEIILGCGAQVRVRKDGNCFIAEEVIFQRGEEMRDPICKPIASIETLVWVLCLFALTTYEKLTLNEMLEVVRDTAAKLGEYHEWNSEYLANLEKGV